LGQTSAHSASLYSSRFKVQGSKLWEMLQSSWLQVNVELLE